VTYAVKLDNMLIQFSQVWNSTTFEKVPRIRS